MKCVIANLTFAAFALCTASGVNGANTRGATSAGVEAQNEERQLWDRSLASMSTKGTISSESNSRRRRRDLAVEEADSIFWDRDLSMSTKGTRHKKVRNLAAAEGEHSVFWERSLESMSMSMPS
jgi:hypothetical protein